MKLALNWVVLSLVLLSPTMAQAGKPCKWCKGDSQELQAAGWISHGPIPVGFKGSADLAKFIDEEDWIFLETPHIRWASTLGGQNLARKDQDRLEQELQRLRASLPSLPKKIRKLDPHLRLHFLALRLEEFYLRFQKLLQVKDEDFPDERQGTGPYMGNGRYMGEKEKFDFILHARRGSHLRFIGEYMGLNVPDAIRWHCKSPHKLLASVVAADSDLRDDRWLYPHLVHNMSHMMLAAYKHFSYDPPIWLDEGLAHAMEREVEPLSFTREGQEGTFQDRSGPSNWEGADYALVKRKKASSLAKLMHKHTVGELTLEDHISCWSMVRFLMTEYPNEFAKFIGGVKGQLDDQGYPSGKDLSGLQRRLIKELWNWTLPQFDEAWRSWVLASKES